MQHVVVSCDREYRGNRPSPYRLPMRRSLITLLVIVGAFATFPVFLHKLFPVRLTDAQFVIHNHPRKLPVFSFSDALGRMLTLNDFRGSFILVNVWATWCPPCKQEMASLDHLALLLADKNIKIAPISIDVSGISTVRPFYDRLGLNNLTIYVDPSKRVMDALGITGIPTTLLIGKEGREIGRMIGPAQWDTPASVKRILGITGS